jgi:hypothetical protein
MIMSIGIDQEGIWLIFRGFNFSRNTDLGQIGHFWMGTK